VDAPSTERQTQKARMGLSQMLLQYYEEHGETFLSRSLTKDETWVFHCTPKSKAESMTLLVRKKFKPLQSPGIEVAAVYCSCLSGNYRNSRRLFGERDEDIDNSAGLHSAAATLNLFICWDW
jgi:hypothetical protein